MKKWKKYKHLVIMIMNYNRIIQHFVIMIIEHLAIMHSNPRSSSEKDYNTEL